MVSGFDREIQPDSEDTPLESWVANLEISTVSLDQSLKRGSRLVRARNVMKRAERIAKLTDEDRWDETKSVLGIPKTKVPKTVAGRKKKKKVKEEDGDDKK
ncbi:MAG: small basic protein (TIGR04137 family) [Planctomycetaceae bacterium]